MISAKGTREAVDYTLHRLTCFDCDPWLMCTDAVALLDARIKAVSDRYARKQEYVRELSGILGRMDGVSSRRLINDLMDHWREDG